ncbi:hypothetical protein Q0Z83_060520 [Actinoplanes sichuanensis]|uniref:Septum formation initiator n=1 Tax=Actinoplanes sichuanensis TaxID=512349 RepID=A0ABW4A5Y7_9ACTN|nr:hypothetical protein [Actinoplanes sichuanensis]BEL07861.1 hypothetical protein Q0Z83_060520 [Actinoplanes sichuanensis]
MTGTTIVFAGAVSAVVIGLGLVAALASMQERLCELKTQRDEARAERDNFAAALADARRHEADALAAAEDAEGRARFATRLLADLRDFSHVNLAYPPDALPDIPTGSLDDDASAWVAEMRERWTYDSPEQ